VEISPLNLNDLWKNMRSDTVEWTRHALPRVLVVLVTTSNTIHNKLIRLDDNITQEELEHTARYLNTEFSGKSLLAIRTEILEMMREEKALYDRLLRNAILLCDMSLEGEEPGSGDVYVDGASNFLSKPDFVDVDRLRDFKQRPELQLFTFDLFFKISCCLNLHISKLLNLVTD